MLFYVFRMAAKIQNQERVRKTCHIIIFQTPFFFKYNKLQKKAEKNCLYIRNAIENICLLLKNRKKKNQNFQNKKNSTRPTPKGQTKPPGGG